jgi:hypothetical protein
MIPGDRAPLFKFLADKAPPSVRGDFRDVAFEMDWIWTGR